MPELADVLTSLAARIEASIPDDPTIPGNEVYVQLAARPRVVDRRRYEDAHSPSNPGGRLASTYRFWSLVDPVPVFWRQYAPSIRSTDRLYGLVVRSAIASGDNPFLAGLIQDARAVYRNTAIHTLDGLPSTTWHPVYASPENWYEAEYWDAIAEENIDVQSGAEPDTVLEGAAPQETGWSVGTGNLWTNRFRLSGSTSFTRIKLKLSFVYLRRPWFFPTLLSTSEWRMPGVARGAFSSGDNRDNDGLFPLLPVALIVARDIEITAHWALEDWKVLDLATSGAFNVGLGPFALSGSRYGLESPVVSYDSQSGSIVGSELTFLDLIDDFKNTELVLGGVGPWSSAVAGTNTFLEEQQLIDGFDDIALTIPYGPLPPGIDPGDPWPLGPIPDDPTPRIPTDFPTALLRQHEDWVSAELTGDTVRLPGLQVLGSVSMVLPTLPPAE